MHWHLVCLARLHTHRHHLHIALHPGPLIAAPGQFEVRQFEDAAQQRAGLRAGLGDVLLGRVERPRDVAGRAGFVLRSLSPGPHTPHRLLQLLGGGRQGGAGAGAGGHQASRLGDLVVQPGSDLVRSLVSLKPRPRLVLGQVDGGGDLLLPGNIAVRLLTVVRTPVPADLNLVMGSISRTNGSANNSNSDAAEHKKFYIFFYLASNVNSHGVRELEGVEESVSDDAGSTKKC